MVVMSKYDAYNLCEHDRSLCWCICHRVLYKGNFRLLIYIFFDFLKGEFYFWSNKLWTHTVENFHFWSVITTDNAFHYNLLKFVLISKETLKQIRDVTFNVVTNFKNLGGTLTLDNRVGTEMIRYIQNVCASYGTLEKSSIKCKL